MPFLQMFPIGMLLKSMKYDLEYFLIVTAKAIGDLRPNEVKECSRSYLNFLQRHWWFCFSQLV